MVLHGFEKIENLRFAHAIKNDYYFLANKGCHADVKLQLTWIDLWPRLYGARKNFVRTNFYIYTNIGPH